MTTPNVAFREWMEKVRRGELPRAPIAELLDFVVDAAEDGAAVASMEVDERFANPMGTLHGGVIVDLADAAMGCAVASTLGEGETFTTIELKANYFKPVWRDRLEARARIVRRTRTLAYVECDVTGREGSLVARIASTCMVLRGAEAAGR